MANSMQHFNGNQLCVIDTETTGLDPTWHEIVQICILPLDSNLDPRKDVMPFYINLSPEHPERASPEALKVNGLKLAELALSGHDPEKARDLLEHWVGKLKLPSTKYGNKKRILPLGQNYPFDQPFIQNWVGQEEYSEIFDSRHRDTMTASLFLNDRAGMHAEKIPYPKNNLAYLASQLKIPHERGHDALQDCIVTAKVYKRLLMQGIFA